MNAGTETAQNIFERQHLLLDSDHAHLLPEGARGLTIREMVNLFGSSTIGNYIRAQEQKNNQSYRDDAAAAYKRLKRVRFLWKQLYAQLSDLQKVTYNTETFRDFIADSYVIRALHSDIVSPSLRAGLSAVIESCADQRKVPEAQYEKAVREIENKIGAQEAISANPVELTAAARKKTRALAEKQAKQGEAAKAFKAAQAIKKIENTLIELSENAHFFKKFGNDPIYRVLDDVERKNSALHAPDEVGEDAILAHHLSHAKRLLETGLFDRETVMREAIGGVSFERELKKRKSAAAKSNLKKGGSFYQKPKKAGGVYHDYYALVTRKCFDPFISETLGLALFAAPKDEDLGRWTVQNVKDVRDFVVSRYDLVHKVLEGVANRNKNPLGAPLSKEQGTAFLHEALKSSLYPEHRTNIRIGIGGTKVDDVRVRLASYAVNALDVMAVFRRASAETCEGQQGINVPTLSLVSGAALATKVNGLNKAEAETNQNRMFYFLRRFVETYYPELKEAVSFERPTEREIFDSTLFETVFSAAQESISQWDQHLGRKKEERERAEKGEIECSADEAPTTKAIINEAPYKDLERALRQLARFSEKRNGGISKEEAKKLALTYGVAHVMPSVFRSVMPEGEYAPSVWKIGGKSEQYFNQLGEALTTLIQNDRRISLPNASGSPFLAGLCTTTVVGGNPPPYYKGPEGSFDPGMKEICTAIKDGSVRDDVVIKTLEDSTSGRSADDLRKNGPAQDLAVFLKHRRLGHGDVRRGWNSYKAFLASFDAA